MKEVLDLATRKGADPVNASDITGELQSLSTQLYYMLVMMLSDRAIKLRRLFGTLLKVLVQKCGASYFGNTNLEWVSDTEQCCNLC